MVNWNPYSTVRSEPDLRQEFLNTLSGNSPEISKGQHGLLRKRRHDANGDFISCGCIDSVTKEPDKDRFCPICYGEGYLWDEEEVLFYKTLEGSDVRNTLADKLIEPGILNTPSVVFYLQYSAGVARGDKIVELLLDDEGDPTTITQRHRLFRINIAQDMRADNGRIEYWKVFTHEEHTRYINAPSFEDM